MTTARDIEEALVLRFSTSHTRRPIFEGWIRLRQAITTFIAVQNQWVNGSFVTAIEDPADLDVVSFVDADTWDHLAAGEQAALEPLFNGRNARTRWMCHSFFVRTYSEPHPLAKAETLMQSNYWNAQWARVNDKDERFRHPRFRALAKGYLEVR